MHTGRAVAAGAIGTGVLSALWLVEPSLGLPTIAVGQILSTFMSVSVAQLGVGVAGGWIIHLLFGILLALIYGRLIVRMLPTRPWVSGAIYGAAVFVVAQTLFMPLVGGGLFSRGDFGLLLGSLLGHLAYGIVVGWIYGLPYAAVERV